MNSDAFWSPRRNGEKSTRRSVLQMLNVYIKEIREFIKYKKDLFSCKTRFYSSFVLMNARGVANSCRLVF